MDALLVAIIIVGSIILYGMYVWAEADCRKRKARQKDKASQPVDYTQINFTYTDEGRIKRLGDELRGMSSRKKISKGEAFEPTVDGNNDTPQTYI